MTIVIKVPIDQGLVTYSLKNALFQTLVTAIALLLTFPFL